MFQLVVTQIPELHGVDSPHGQYRSTVQELEANGVQISRGEISKTFRRHPAPTVEVEIPDFNATCGDAQGNTHRSLGKSRRHHLL